MVIVRKYGINNFKGERKMNLKYYFDSFTFTRQQS